MLSERQIQRCVAHLELARTAIDNSELRIVGAPDSERPGLSLVKACGEISAAAENLKLCVQEIESWARVEMEKLTNASTVDGVTAGKPVVP